MLQDFLEIGRAVKRFKISDDVPFRVQLSWFNLSFTAGAINAGGFLSCQRFVSHVTGFVTISGLNFGQQAFKEALSALSIPGFFLLGAMISAFLTENDAADTKISKHFAPTMAIVAFILLLIITFGSLGYFGPFGESQAIQADYVLIALLCLICGIQNAAVTALTGASVRPTHLTGTTTDIGIGMVRAFRNKSKSEDQRREWRTNWRRINLVIAFVVGVMIGSAFFFRLQYWGFVVPLVTSLISMGESIYDLREAKQRRLSKS
jgi:uncharacterized membrane protein YoaK (UPF0700 family)